MIPNILQFIYDNSSKEFSCPFLKNFIEKKIEKKNQDKTHQESRKMQKNL